MNPRSVVTIAINSVRSQLSERGTLFVNFIMPLLMMVVIGTSTSNFIGTGTLDIVRSAGDPLADAFVASLRTEGDRLVSGKKRFHLCDLAVPVGMPAECGLGENGAQIAGDLAALAETRLNDKTVAASVVLPADFGIVAKSQTGSTQVEVRVRGDNATTGQTVSALVQAAITRLGSSIAAARAAINTGGSPSNFDAVLEKAQILWDREPVQIVEIYSTSTGTQAGTGFGQSAPGIGAMFVMIGALALPTVFIVERTNWTLQRLIMMPVRRSEILAGKLIGQFLLGLLTFSVMIAGGTLLGVRWGDPLGVLVIVLTFTLAVTALGLLLSTLLKTQGQALGMGMLVPMILAPLGGAWWPLAIVPQTMQTIGYTVSPIAWSQKAFNEMVFYNAGFSQVLPYAGVLLIFAAGFFVIGVLRFRLD